MLLVLYLDSSLSNLITYSHCFFKLFLSLFQLHPLTISLCIQDLALHNWYFADTFSFLIELFLVVFLVNVPFPLSILVLLFSFVFVLVPCIYYLVKASVETKTNSNLQSGLQRSFRDLTKRISRFLIDITILIDACSKVLMKLLKKRRHNLKTQPPRTI